MLLLSLPFLLVFLGAAGISCFIVEKDMKGLTFGAKEDKVKGGWGSLALALALAY